MDKEPTALFLDCDGVLNRCAASGFGLEEDKLLLLSEIVDRTNCSLVLSSTWRTHPAQLIRLRIALENRGMLLHSMTPVLDAPIEGSRIINAQPRWKEIQAWLDDHPETRRFVILDDEPWFGPLSHHHFRTHSEGGLNPALVEGICHYLKDD